MQQQEEIVLSGPQAAMVARLRASAAQSRVAADTAMAQTKDREQFLQDFLNMLLAEQGRTGNWDLQERPGGLLVLAPERSAEK